MITEIFYRSRSAALGLAHLQEIYIKSAIIRKPVQKAPIKIINKIVLRPCCVSAKDIGYVDFEFITIGKIANQHIAGQAVQLAAPVGKACRIWIPLIKYLVQISHKLRIGFIFVQILLGIEKEPCLCLEPLSNINPQIHYSGDFACPVIPAACIRLPIKNVKIILPHQAAYFVGGGATWHSKGFCHARIGRIAR